MNYEDMSIGELIDLYHKHSKPENLKIEIIRKKFHAIQFMNKYKKMGMLTEQNIADIEANIARIEALFI